MAEIPDPLPVMTFVGAMIVSAISLKLLQELDPEKQAEIKDSQEAYYEVQESSRIQPDEFS